MQDSEEQRQRAGREGPGHAEGRGTKSASGEGPSRAQEDEGDDEEMENGRRTTVKLQDLSMPTKAEREEHDKTHLPFRSWCRHCVRGRGNELPHRSNQCETEGVEMSFDFFFGGMRMGASR